MMDRKKEKAELDALRKQGMFHHYILHPTLQTQSSLAILLSSSYAGFFEIDADDL